MKKKFKVREKSGNFFYFSQGNLKFWQKSGNFRIRSDAKYIISMNIKLFIIIVGTICLLIIIM